MRRAFKGLAGAFRVAAAVTLSVSVDGVHACPMCFGAAESPMAAGVDAGVSVLIGVIAFVLVGVAGAGLFWIHRGRRFHRPVDGPVETN